MSRNTSLKILNPFLFFLVITQATTGFMKDSIPPEFFEMVHEGGGIALVVGVFLHLVLNWSWVAANLTNAPRRPKQP